MYILLILDDSTSAVDTKTDSLIRKAFKEEKPENEIEYIHIENMIKEKNRNDINISIKNKLTTNETGNIKLRYSNEAGTNTAYEGNFNLKIDKDAQYIQTSQTTNSIKVTEGEIRGDEKTINIHNDEDRKEVLNSIKNLGDRISDHSKDYVGYRIFKEIL